MFVNSKKKKKKKKEVFEVNLVKLALSLSDAKGHRDATCFITNDMTHCVNW